MAWDWPVMGPPSPTRASWSRLRVVARVLFMRWSLVAVLLVTAGCLIVVLWGLKVEDARLALSQAHLAVLFPLTALYLVASVIRTARYNLLLRAPVPFRDLFGVVAVSFLAVNVVPLRMGEFVRPYLLAERYKIEFGHGVAAVVLERVLDLIGLLVLLALVALDMPDRDVVVKGVDLIKVGQWTIGSAVATALVGVGTLAIVGLPAVRFLERVVGRVSMSLAGKVGRMGTTFVEGVRTLASRPRDAAVAVLLTGGIWVVGVLACWTAMHGFPGLGARLDEAMFSWAATLTAITLVPTPGFFGSFEAGAAGSLAVLGYDPNLARVYGVAYHLYAFGFTAVLGLIFMALRGIDLVGSVRRSRDANKAS